MNAPVVIAFLSGMAFGMVALVALVAFAMDNDQERGP